MFRASDPGRSKNHDLSNIVNLSKSIGSAARALGYGLGTFRRGMKIGASQGSAERWEGFEMDRRRDRPGRRLSSQDADLNFGTREGMLSEARALAQTYPIVRRILRQYANRCVGSCRIKWDTGDRDIDRIYDQEWIDWMNIADSTGTHHFRKLTKLAVSQTIGDGDIFGQKIKSGDYGQLKMIEGDRVSSSGIYNFDTPQMVGGIGLDANGRNQFIRVWHRTLYGYFDSFQEIPWAQVLHVFDPDRVDAKRGVTHLHTVLNSVRDLKETTRAEHMAAKRNSKLALIIKTIFGGATKGAVNLWADEDDSKHGGNDKVRVQEVNDATDAYMFPTEDMKAHSADRPSDGWIKLMEWVVREIALGLDLPFGVVWHMAGLGGPAARFEIGQANNTFMSFSDDVIDKRWMRPIAGWTIACAIEKKRVPFTPKWFSFKTPRPAAITIDLGRDSKSAIEENRMGLLTATSWYAENDEDFEDQTDRLAYEAAYRRKAIKKYEADGVVLEDIRLLMPNGNPNAGDEPDADDAEAATATKGTQDD